MKFVNGELQVQTNRLTKCAGDKKTVPKVVQKQPVAGVLRVCVLKEFGKIYRKTPAMESLFE